MIPTYQIAMAAGRDAGNRSMKANGRKAWNFDDWNASCDTFNKIMEIIEPKDLEEASVSGNAQTPTKGAFNASSSLNLFIRFGSHRAREYGMRALQRKPQGFYSRKRNSHPGGFYQVTRAEVDAMRAYSNHARFTILRAPYDDLMKCWSI